MEYKMEFLGKYVVSFFLVLSISYIVSIMFLAIFYKGDDDE